MIKIYDSLTKRKKKLYYDKDKTIKIYICGITVYNYCHIGHARVFLLFDSLIRYLNQLKIKIVFIRNITDIDDKIIKKATLKKKSINYISEKYTKKMHIDIKNLNLIEPTFEPKATNFISEMVENIEKLYKKQYAYTGKNGDIYYNISKKKKYGKLSEREIINDNKLEKNKKFSSDFTLWKKLNENITWTSPWGKGRPGWHTECFTMVNHYFNTGINIHGGGKDLLFPHHENEIAQYESLNKFKMAKHWMHVGFLNINEKKMSKTLENTILIKNILKNNNEEYLRYFMLKTHYRKDMEYSTLKFEQTKISLNSLYNILLKFPIIKKKNILNTFNDEFIKALNNDFNTPAAIFVLFDIVKQIKNTKTYTTASKLVSQLKFLGNILGILKNDPKLFLNKNIKFKTEYINDLIKKRIAARISKNWKKADNIRDKLIKLGINVTDDKII